MTETPCDYCGESPAKRGGRFCTSRCKAAWHREHDPEGVLRGGPKVLTSGRVAVTVLFEGHDGERALRLPPRAPVVLGEVVPETDE